MRGWEYTFTVLRGNARLRARLDRLMLSARTAVGQDRAAITGDPNASVDLLRQALESVIGEGELMRALRESAEKLLEETEKLNLVTLFCLEKLSRSCFLPKGGNK